MSKQTAIAVLDVVVPVVGVAGFLLPPWNVAWWAIGAGVWVYARCVTPKHKEVDPTGHGALLWLAAPAYAAAAPLYILKKKLRET
jgi:hypothetical protein